MDIRLELIGVPVTDVDRAKAFYERVGFHADHDVTVSEDIRFVQLTPPGSACSIALGRGITAMAPGSLDNMQVVVTDIEEAHADLTARGIEVSDISDQPWGSFVYFQDPDGNRWSVQQTTPRGAA
ncbi:VOC family protein [Streptomyces sp. NPDC008122]|uniref:VOC family protein n=1 Tax=Streptomyces sp. NPDC008122 TaxID=3364810 RepID=UPI0036F0227C